MRKRVLAYVLARMGEASTWRGAVVILTALGVHLSPDQVAGVLTAGLGLSGLVGVMFADKT